jgi:hypothetical protein
MRPRFTSVLLLLIAVAASLALWLQRPRHARGIQQAGTAPESAHNGDEPGIAPAPTTEGRQSSVPVSPTAERSAVRSGLSRGRLVDARTLEPIQDALVVAGRSKAVTDAGGWFDAQESLDELGEVLVLNVGGLATHTVARERWLKEDDHWRVPLAIGPTYWLWFGCGVAFEHSGWESRLTWDGAKDRAWRDVSASSPPYLRYDAPLSGPSDGGPCWIEARSRDGLTEARGEVKALFGVSDVALACRPRVVVRGRVLDALGRPLGAVGVSAVHISDAGMERLNTKSDATGAYQLVASEPGRIQLQLTSTAETRGRQFALELPRGLTQAPNIVFDARDPPGSIRGRLKSRSGERVAGTVRVRALDGSGYEQECWSNGMFALESVPRGRFEVSIVSDSAFPCAPIAQQVEVPAEGLVFTQEDGGGTRNFHFEATDENSGEPLQSVRVEVRSTTGAVIVRDLKRDEVLQLASNVLFQWRAWVGGYGLTSGDESAFAPEGDGLVARIAMHKGFSTRLVLREWSEIENAEPVPVPVHALPKAERSSPSAAQRPRSFKDPGTEFRTTRRRGDSSRFEGAEILADGVLVARADGLGVAELDLVSPPARIDVRLPGWRVLDSHSFSRNRAVSSSEAEVFLVRE